MSTETLRAASKLMRERADHPEVSAEPWSASPHGDVHDNGSLWVCDSQSGPTAEHIASWHPAVALVVADWLDVIAGMYPDGHSIGNAHALRVARAYLGEDQ